MVSVHDVANAYILLLGRPTEPGWVADGWVTQTPEVVARNLLSSGEFAAGVARPVLGGRMPATRYAGGLTDPVRQWAAAFFDVDPVTRDAIAQARDWAPLLGALFADERFATSIGRQPGWAWPQLARQFAIAGGTDDPDALAGDVVDRVASGLRLVALAGFAKAGASRLRVTSASPSLAFELAMGADAGQPRELTLAIETGDATYGADLEIERTIGEPDAPLAIHARAPTVVVARGGDVKRVIWRPYLPVGATIRLDRIASHVSTPGSDAAAAQSPTPCDSRMLTDAYQRTAHAAVSSDAAQDRRVMEFVRGLLDRRSPLLKAKWLARYGFAWEQGAEALVAIGRDPDFVGTPLFDRRWYGLQAPAVGEADYFTALHDYINDGQFRGLSPNPFFLGDRYLAAHPDSRDSMRKGVTNSALEDLAQDGNDGTRIFALDFDPDYYRTSSRPIAIDGVDPSEFDLSPFAHYVHIGWQEGRRPNRVFDADWFDRHAPRADAHGIVYPNAFSRYLHGGEEMKRHISPFFDPDCYLAWNPDVARRVQNEPAFDALTHFLTNGRRDRRRADAADLSRRVVAMFPRAFPAGAPSSDAQRARDALLTLATDRTDHDAVGEAVWRYGEPIRNVRHGGEIVAFAGQTMRFHISGLAAMPQARLVDIQLENAPFVVDRDFVTFPTLEDAVDIATLSGEAAGEGGYCAWFSIDLEGAGEGRIDLPVRFVFERDGLQRSFEGPRLTLRIAATPPVSATSSDVQVLMATYDPPETGFKRQVETIRAQKPSTVADRLSLVISDDASPPEGARLVTGAATLPRIEVSYSRSNLGFVRNFERALQMRSPDARMLLFADQDDAWYPDKVARLQAQLDEGACCAFSDMRILDASGGVVSTTFWDSRRVHAANPIALAVANAVTGAATAFTRELADLLSPFPSYVGLYHDQWLAVLASAVGRVGYVDAPLYDYIQHSGNVLGFGGSRANHVGKWRAIRARLRRALRHADASHWSARDLAALRAADQAMPELLQRFVLLREALARAAQWRDPMVRMLAEALCGLVSGAPVNGRAIARAWYRMKRESGGDAALIGIDYRMEATLLGLYAMRRHTSLHACVAKDRLDEMNAYARLEARLADESVTNYAKKIAPIPVAITPVTGAHAMRINIFLPELSPSTFFGGYHSKISLVSRLIARGHRVRIILVDQPAPDYMAIADIGEAFPELIDALETAEIVGAGARDTALPFDHRDALIATTWWSAHIVDAIRSTLGQSRFAYLIQEYEPFTFNLGTWYRGAEETYDLPHMGIYSTDIMRAYFVGERIGQFAGGPQSAQPWLSFDNPVTGLGTLARVPPDRRRRRLLFYARPQPHAARNMYEFGVEALRMAAATLGDALDGWEIVGVGADAPMTVDLGSGRTLTLTRKLDADGYRRMLAAADVGLALMYTPHPSLVPIEMAAAGLVTVTNTCMTKTAETMAGVSPDLIVAPVDVPGIAAAIVEAVRRALRPDRVTAPVQWPTTPAEAFPDAWIDRLETMLRDTLVDIPVAPVRKPGVFARLPFRRG